MNTTKYLIWDNEKKEWFKPTYPRNKQTRTEEILFSQSGEMYLHAIEDTGERSVIHVPELARFIPCRYTEIKDDNDEKVYENDIIQHLYSGEGRVIMKDGSWMIDWITYPSFNPELLKLEKLNKEMVARKFIRLGSSLENPILFKQIQDACKAE